MQTTKIKNYGHIDRFLSAAWRYECSDNRRQLVTKVESALAVAYQDPILFRRHMPTEISVRIATEKIQQKKNDVPALSFNDGCKRAIEKYAQGYLRKIAVVAVGELDKMCELSGLSKSRMYELLKKHRIDIQKDSVAKEM